MTTTRMDIQWTTHTLLYGLPDSSEENQQNLLSMGLAPLTEQADHWQECQRLDDSSDETSDVPPSLRGHSVIMYYYIRHGSGFASISTNLTLDSVLRVMEAPLRRSEKESLAHQREIRDHVARNNEVTTLIVYDWPQGDPVTSHVIKQVMTYRREQ